MAAPNRHIIRQLTLEAAKPKREGAIDLQESLSELFWNDILGDLERLFDEWAGPDELIRIDRLELNLGSMRESDIREEMKKRLLEALREQLERHIRYPGKEVKRLPMPLGRFEQWLFFLENGYFHWSSTGDPREEAFRKAVLGEIASQSSAVGRLRALASQKPEALKRIVWEHSDDFLLRLMGALAGAPQGALPAVFRVWERVLPHALRREARLLRAQAAQAVGKGQTRLLFWHFALALALGQERKTTPQRLNAAFVRTISSDPQRFLQLTARILWEEAPEMISLPELKIIDKRLPGMVQSISAQAGTNKTRGLKDPLESPPAGKKEMDETAPLPTTERKAREIQEGALVYQKGAGAVLLHPFLPAFFRELGLLDEKTFRDEEARAHGVRLLHYLTFGRAERFEHEMTLGKILCGMPLHAPIDSSQPLRPEEEAEADDLLRAVISHWKALGNVSPEGLREGFLQREGRLERQARGWKLYVSRKTEDILLDRIPWGIGMVKLSWMEEALKVEW